MKNMKKVAVLILSVCLIMVFANSVFAADDDDLFNSSLIYFEESGFEIVSKTYDLHKEPIFENNIETEHEKMFSEQGIKIKALIAKRK